MRQEWYLTTQPGWTVASSWELRTRGIDGQVTSCHRDSTLLAALPLPHNQLLTPAAVFGCLLRANATGTEDATAVLARRLEPRALKAAALRWLTHVKGPRRRSYCILSEVHGQTASTRKILAGAVGVALRHAFPHWKRTAADGLHFSCTADPQTALLGLQLYTNLTRHTEGREGTLRDHLACGLLIMARVQPQDVILDPFMGTGTILRMAATRFKVRHCIGLEVDPGTYALAQEQLAGTDARLVQGSFERFHRAQVPKRVKVVSNLPFGVKFPRVPTDALVQFLFRELDPEAVSLLMSRDQAKAFRTISGLAVKNVLVLGQPASIVYSLTPAPCGR